MELLDVVDINGIPTGKTIVRGDKSYKFKEGEYVHVGVIFIENDEHEYLIQKTSKEKGGYYSSTGGHIDHGELPDDSIKREVEEELGINVDDDNIEKYGYIIQGPVIKYIYYLYKNIDINKCVLQEEEVEAIKYMTVDEINNLIDDDLMLSSHAAMFKELLKRKNNKKVLSKHI